MEPEQIGRAVAAVAAALVERQQPTITGAQLGMLIKKAAPPPFDMREAVDMQSGSGALRKFVEKYLSGYLSWHSSGAGGDPVYAVIGLLPPKARSLHSEEIWSTFVRPNAANALYIDSKSSDLVLAPQGEPPTSTHKEVRKVTEEELGVIQKEFLGGLASPAEVGLRAALMETKSYSAWLEVLREQNSEQYRKWGAFRRSKLEDLFATRLRNAGIPVEQHAEVIEKLRTSQAAVHQRRAVTETQLRQEQPAASPPQQAHQKNEELLRTSIAYVLNAMSIDELRNVQLPFGAAFDGISKVLRRN